MALKSLNLRDPANYQCTTQGVHSSSGRASHCERLQGTPETLNTQVTALPFSEGDPTPVHPSHMGNSQL